MKGALLFPGRKARELRQGRASFTLVEILVSVAILTFILLLLARMMGMVNQAYSAGRSRVDNFTKSRAMLDLVASDLQRGVFRSDLPAFGTGIALATNGGTTSLVDSGSTNAFFTRRAGVGDNVRNVSLVVYLLNVSATNAVLERAECPVPWSLGGGDWSGFLPFNANLGTVLGKATSTEVAEGVLAFNLVFRRSDGGMTNAYTGYISTNPVVAIGVSLAVVDSQTLRVLSAANFASLSNALSASFADSLARTNGIKAGWDAALGGGFFNPYPKPLAAGLRTFERWVPCQPPF